MPTSSVGLAVNNVAREKNKVYINTGSATSDLTGPQCSPNTVHWTYDTYMLAKSTGGAMVKAGGDSWFFITADYAFGHALERDTDSFVKAAAARSRLRAAIPSRHHRFLLLPGAGAGLQAPRSSASPMPATTRSTASSRRRVRPHQARHKLAALLMFLPDVHALGLQTAQGLVLTEASTGT